MSAIGDQLCYFNQGVVMRGAESLQDHKIFNSDKTVCLIPMPFLQYFPISIWQFMGTICHILLSFSGVTNVFNNLKNGYVNKQNCRIWSEANPQVYVETPLHPEKLTVWCALWAGGIIGPYFLKNDEDHNVTVNGDRYRAMITNCFIPELNNHDVQELWFQQDCATCHTARATIDLLKDTFGDRLISRFEPVNWPPRSCDLTPLDYFLWGYVKSLVYADKPQTLDNLEDNIRRVIADIRPQMLEKVIENWTSRLDYIRASRGSHMPELIFKMYSNYSKYYFINTYCCRPTQCGGYVTRLAIEWVRIPSKAWLYLLQDASKRNRRQYEQLTDFDRGRIIGLREAGWSNRRIDRHLGRSDMVVARCWQQWITEGRVYRRGGSGRPRNTNDREDRAIRRVVTSAPTSIDSTPLTSLTSPIRRRLIEEPTSL
ncbi:putative DD41D transposase [Trichonephila clavipes]|nr:putative DD41D transposase [Trichonephila clavipes]